MNISNPKPFNRDQTTAPGEQQARRREVWPVPPVAFTRDHHVDERALDELVEFYVQARVDGLFILAYSGEAFELTDQERLAICQQIIKQVAGRLRIVVTGNFGCTLDEQIEQIKRIAEFGPDAAIVFLSTLPNRARMVDDLLQIARQVDGPLGIYECPVPEHRLLSADDVKVLAESGQFVFMKETSRDRNVYRDKLLASRNSPLKLYQANWGQLPRSLEDGGPGLCGIIANMFPELVDAYCNSDALSPAGRESLHAILSDVLACVTERHYPATMKYLLQRRGLPIHTVSRMNGVRDVDADDAQRLDEMLGELDLLRQPNEIVASVANRIGETGHAGLRGPHRSAKRTPRTSAAADHNEFD